MARQYQYESGQAPIDAYTEEPTLRLMYLEKTAFSGSVFSNQVATIRAKVPDSATISGMAVGLVIRDDIGSGATVGSFRGIYMYHCSESAMPDGDASFIRFEDNSATATYGMNAIIEYAGSNSSTVGTETFITTNSAQAPWFKGTSTVATQNGMIKCNINGTSKYIALYNSAT